MKKNIPLLTAALLILIIFTGCATTGAANSSKTSGTQTSTTAAATPGIVVTDWFKKADGEDMQPDWLQDLAFGNSSSYLKAYGKTAGSSSKRFIVLTAGKGSDLDEAQTNAENDMPRALSTEMYILLHCAMEPYFNEDQDALLYKACMQIEPEASVKKEGHFWQHIQETTKKGKVTDSYVDYGFYSMTQEKYKEQEEKYLEAIFQSEILDRETLVLMITHFDAFEAILDESNTSMTGLKKDAWGSILTNHGINKSDSSTDINPVLLELMSEYLD